MAFCDKRLWGTERAYLLSSSLSEDMQPDVGYLHTHTITAEHIKVEIGIYSASSAYFNRF